MAKKLVGRNGRELLSVPVTETGGRTLPKTRPSKKYKEGLFTLTFTLTVGILPEPASPKADDVYKVLTFYRYRWNGQKWVRLIPDGFQLDKEKTLTWIRRTHGETNC